MEDENEFNTSKITREELKNSFSQFNEFLEANKEWEREEDNTEDTEIYGSIVAVSEWESDPEILQAIEELEPDSDTELDQRVDSLISRVKKELKGIKAEVHEKENNSYNAQDSVQLELPSEQTVKPDAEQRKSVTFAPSS